jgi:hypothetical protein
MFDEVDSALKHSACERLRRLVPDCVSKHLYKSAVFFAGKLCTMSDNQPSDVYLLAQVCISHADCLAGEPLSSDMPGASCSVMLHLHLNSHV